MIKFTRPLSISNRFYDTLVVPVIENTAREAQLTVKI
jgi:hypothetical protein